MATLQELQALLGSQAAQPEKPKKGKTLTSFIDRAQAEITKQKEEVKAGTRVAPPKKSKLKSFGQFLKGTGKGILTAMEQSGGIRQLEEMQREQAQKAKDLGLPADVIRGFEAGIPEQTLEERLATLAPKTVAEKRGQTTGKLGFALGTTVAGGAPFRQIIGKAAPALEATRKGRALTGAITSPVETTIFEQTFRGEAPSGKEIAAGVGLDALISAILPGPSKAAVEALAEAAEAPGRRAIVEAVQEVTAPAAPAFDSTAYVRELVEAQDAARKTGQFKGMTSKASQFYSKAKESLVDFTAPIEDLLAKTQKEFKFKVLPKADIRFKIDEVLRAPIAAGDFVRREGLEKVIQNVGSRDALAEFDQYLIARQAQDVAAKGVETGRDLAKDKLLIEALDSKWGEAAQQVHDYSRKLLDYATDTGLISKELNAALKEQYPNYVPLNRVFNEIEEAIPGIPGRKSVASVSTQNIVKKLKGSEREIESPIVSLLSKTNDAFAQGTRNKAARVLGSYANLPGWKDVLREIKPGESVPAHMKFSYLDNGVKKTFVTTPEIAAAAKNLNAQQFGALEKLVSYPTRALKVGATGLNVAFAGANVVKDRVFAMINAKPQIAASLANPFNFFEALVGVTAKRKDVFQELIQKGAAGNSFDLSRSQIPKTIDQILANKNKISKVAYTVKNPSELVKAAEDLIGVSEDVTRLQVYQAAKRMYLRMGRTLEDAELLAADEARNVTTNFFRRGTWGQALNATIPYLNAGIQGNRAFFKAISERPVDTAARVATGLFFPTAAVTAWNLADPMRREAYLDIPDWEKENNLILLPPVPTMDDKGRWNAIKLPMTPNLGSLARMVSMSVEHLSEADQATFQDMAKQLIGATSPVDVTSATGLASALTPQALKPGLEFFSNTNFFTGQSIVPPSLENLPPELQYKDTTSQVAKELGELLGLSPLKVENFIKSSFAGLGNQAVNAIDKALIKTGVAEGLPGGETPWENFVRRFTKAYGGNLDALEHEQISAAMEAQAVDRKELKDKANDLYEELSNMPREQANNIANGIKESDPELYDKLKQVTEAKKKDLSGIEKRMLGLGVSNGMRAEFIMDHLMTDYQTDDERNARYQELKDKGVISKNVDEQLKALKNQSTATPGLGELEKLLGL